MTNPAAPWGRGTARTAAGKAGHRSHDRSSAHGCGVTAGVSSSPAKRFQPTGLDPDLSRST